MTPNKLQRGQSGGTPKGVKPRKLCKCVWTWRTDKVNQTKLYGLLLLYYKDKYTFSKYRNCAVCIVIAVYERNYHIHVFYDSFNWSHIKTWSRWSLGHEANKVSGYNVLDCATFMNKYGTHKNQTKCQGAMLSTILLQKHLYTITCKTVPHWDGTCRSIKRNSFVMTINYVTIQYPLKDNLNKERIST